MDNGWIKLHRKVVGSQVWQNPALLKVWCWCLLKANHKETWVSVITGRGTTEVKLLPGQFIYGRKSAGKELKMKPESIRNRMQKLKTMQNLTIQPATHYSIVTICNWDEYQNEEYPSNHPTNHPKANQQPTIDQPKATDKNVEKVKNVKKSIPLIPFGGDSQWEKFWTAYPKRKSKQDAIKAWNQLEPDDGLLQIMLAAIQKHRETEQWQKESGEFIPYPATWIRGRLWEDETGEIIGEDDNEQKWSAEEGRYLPSKRKLREQREGRG